MTYMDKRLTKGSQHHFITAWDLREPQQYLSLPDWLIIDDVTILGSFHDGYVIETAHVIIVNVSSPTTSSHWQSIPPVYRHKDRRVVQQA